MGKFAGFSSVQLKKPLRSQFDLSHQKRLTTRMGRLTPILCIEAIPSDTFRGSSEILLRLAPLLAPIYDQIELYVHYFFVPNRLLWEEWEEFITGGRLGVGIDPLSAPIPPFYDIGVTLSAQPDKFAKSSLADYMGVPDLLSIEPTIAAWNGKTLDAMPILAYGLIYLEYYRDRNYVDDSGGFSYPVPSGELLDYAYLDLQKRSYLHDYFTSALPFTQRGEEVMMPVAFDGYVPLAVNPLSGTSEVNLVTGIEDGSPDNGWGPIETVHDNAIIPDGQIRAHVTGVSSITSINDFRAAYALQVWLERNAVAGSRYTESTQAHFGVKPQDSRLQRPEYIGGGRIGVRISEVVSTSWSEDGDAASIPQGNLAGHGVTYGNTNQFNYFCTEHGFILGIASIMNPPSYQQGLPRMFRRRSFLDYPWPTFAKLGEQQVNDYEIYCTPASLTEEVETGEVPLFGYQSRYADWKYVCTTNHGEFKDTFLFWTLTRVFESAPALGEEFVIFDDVTQDRIFAVPNTDNFWMYVHNNISVRRPLPYFGTPNTMGFA